MAGTSKVMLWALGDSISYSYLSWKAKIAWPCVLSKTDEQGRYVADPKIFKGILCSLIEEIQPEDVEPILSELEEQRMVITYQSDGLLLGQVVNRWKYNKPAYAARSKYPPPEGWTDRIHEKEGAEHIFENWETKGGFGVKNSTEEDSIEQYRGDMGISSSSNKQETRKTSRKKPDTPHHRVVAGYIERIAKGYSKRYTGEFKGDLKKIKAMLERGHSEEDILACYDSFKAEAFWAAKHLSMRTIDKNIDDWKKAGGTSGKDRRRDQGPTGTDDKQYLRDALREKS